jgi:ATP-dependent Clp protease ATP-binding subunit ClpA
MKTDTIRAGELVQLAQAEAVAAQSPAIEAEHFLLALTGPRGGAARDLLAGAGLDRAAVERALATETERSLAYAGVTLTSGMPQASFFLSGRMRVGASARTLLYRASKAAKAGGESRIGPQHLLLGLLNARVGTVPRALDLAGVDRPALIARALGGGPATGG